MRYRPPRLTRHTIGTQRKRESPSLDSPIFAKRYRRTTSQSGRPDGAAVAPRSSLVSRRNFAISLHLQGRSARTCGSHPAGTKCERPHDSDAAVRPFTYRDGRIRTGDPLNPIQVRYRTAPRPATGGRAVWRSGGKLLALRIYRSPCSTRNIPSFRLIALPPSDSLFRCPSPRPRPESFGPNTNYVLVARLGVQLRYAPQSFGYFSTTQSFNIEGTRRRRADREWSPETVRPP